MSDLTLVQRAEWDFNDVPAKEESACLYYEYARENTEVRSDLKLWLSIFPHGCIWPKDEEEISKKCRGLTKCEKMRIFHFYDSSAVIAAVTPRFPSIPWMQIPPDDRRRFLKEINWGKTEQRLAYFRRFPHESRDDPPSLYPITFEITDWSPTNKVLVKKFREWLRTARPIEQRNKRAGRINSMEDLFSHLKALRLSRLSKKDIALATKGSIIDPSNFKRSVIRAIYYAQTYYRSQNWGIGY